MSTTLNTDPLVAAMGPSGAIAPPTPADLAPHLPDLEIEALIGQGGMGAVYRVRRRADGKLLALKVVRPETGKEAAFAARFAREAEALERLRHPNIVAIHGHGAAGPWCWLLMDLVEGANLREIVATGRLGPAQTLALVPPLCAALQYAHDQGVVHRDLKPENILLDAAGEPHLVDFGLAKLRDGAAGSDLTNTGAGMGTVHYMAPEQVASAKDVDHRADIYALGVVLYELLTGELPLGRFENPSQRAAVDARIDAVVLKALERDRERRWQEMRQVGQAVADTAAPAMSQRAWRPLNLLAGVAAALYAVAVAGGLLYAKATHQTGEPPLWYVAGLVVLILAMLAWGIATLLHQGRTRMLWLGTGVLVSLIVAGCVIDLTQRIREAERASQAKLGEPEERRPYEPIVFHQSTSVPERTDLQTRLAQHFSFGSGLVISGNDWLSVFCQESGLKVVPLDPRFGDRTTDYHALDTRFDTALSVFAHQLDLRCLYKVGILYLVPTARFADCPERATAIAKLAGEIARSPQVAAEVKLRHRPLRVWVGKLESDERDTAVFSETVIALCAAVPSATVERVAEVAAADIALEGSLWSRAEPSWGASNTIDNPTTHNLRLTLTTIDDDRDLWTGQSITRVTETFHLPPR